MRTEKEICKTCYDIQDACNFFPVACELGKTLSDLKTAGVNHWELPNHPAVIILVDKINDMMHRPDCERVMLAMSHCREMAHKPKDETYPDSALPCTGHTAWDHDCEGCPLDYCRWGSADKAPVKS